MSSTDLNEDDPSFLALPVRLRHRIDDAFNSTALSVSRSHGLNASPGGFIVEESEPGPSHSAESESGGFIVEDLPSETFGAWSYIPLSEIPRALSLLNLSPDDDIIGVFENAATGWGAQSTRNDRVSRKDWRAVCTALLEGEHVDGSDEENMVADEGFEMGVDSGPESDEYEMEQPSSDTEEASSSDGYGEPSRTTTRAKKTQKVTSTEAPGTSRQLTESQKTQCRQDFRRFFPGVPDNKLDSQRIMIKDVARVAGLLKENLKTEEVLEMLGAFSSAPDNSMSLADFERMMVQTKLI